jgi:5-dehydro-4-deoxyglucarate dehydratase
MSVRPESWAPLAGSRGPLAGRLSGLLCFPVTPSGPAGGLAVEAYRRHLRTSVDGGCGAVFACCGTGEFATLDLDEYAAAIGVAVAEVAGQVPVVAAVGYGTGLAKRCARLAEESGVDGLLVMPPYLINADQDGLRRHYLALAEATGLDLIVYQRDNVVLTPDTVATLAQHPRIIGLKDGHGDLDLLQRTISAVRTTPGTEGFRYFNGMPTAEMSALAFRGIGVSLYSSAVYCFAPDIALAFHDGLRRDDRALLDRLLDGFYRPFVELRQRGSNYAISLVKAGVRLTGLDVGPVRPPLTEPDPEHVKELARLVEAGRAVLAG